MREGRSILLDKARLDTIYERIKAGHIKDTPDILVFHDDEHNTLAHRLASNNAPTVRSDYELSYMKKPRIGKRQRLLAMEFMNAMKSRNIWRTEDRQILALSNDKGVTVAHLQAYHGWTTEDKSILKFSTNDGITLAQLQAEKGWQTEDYEILRLSDNKGVTVAHIQASLGWTTENKGVLNLKTHDGWAVAHEQVMHLWETDNPEILKITTGDDYNLREVLEFRASRRCQNLLLELAKTLEKPTITKARTPWTRYDLDITNKNKTNATSSIVSEHFLELSYFISKIGDAFNSESRLDEHIKRDFFARIANAANKCLLKSDKPNANMICAAMLHEAFTICDETEECPINYAPLAFTKSISAFQRKEPLTKGYEDNQKTIEFFALKGISISSN